jgi:hypothetical protein
MLASPVSHRSTWICSRAGLLAALLLSAAGACAAEKKDSTALSSDKLERLVADLGSHDYRTRESATRQLTDQGPAAIEALAKAAQTRDLEVSYRAVRILESLMDCGDPTTQDRIAESLKSLADQETTSAAGLASDVLALYQFTLSDRAMEQLRKLGAVVTLSEELPLMSPGFVQITLSDNWKGAASDLKLLKQVRNLLWLHVVNIDLADADLASIGELAQVSQVDLWGTGASPAAVEKLAAALPNCRVDRRTGALLGVRGSDSMPSCMVMEVQPGTAAENAGIRVGDEILSFNGEPVHNFEEFTAFVATKKGGDEVKLELRRDGRVITKDVTLGKLTADVATGIYKPRIVPMPVIPPVGPPVVPQR